MTQARNLQELYDIYKNEVQAVKPELTDFQDGSNNDILAGATALLAQEIQRLLIDRFKKTYFQGAVGDDLETLAVDHFGDSFARPAASPAVGVVTFSRPDISAGDVTIAAGTIVKTSPDANGQSQRFSVTFGVLLTGTTINASVEAVDAGLAGNVGAGDINVIETALTDPTVTVTNADETSGGEEIPNDADYRDFIERNIQALAGATKTAIQATALNVAGVETASPIEFIQTVIEWDDASDLPIGEAFKISRTKLYVADANGSANDALIANVEAAIDQVRACGVFIEVLGAVAVSFDWNASLTLDSGGPNFAALQADPQPIIDTMISYIQDLDIGTGFNRNLAKAAVMAVWGPAGSGDLTNFVTNTPSGDVDVDENEKLIPGTIGTT